MTAHPTDPLPLWTADEVAAYLRVSRSWVYQKAAADELPSLRFAGCLRFDPQAIRAYVQTSAGARVLPIRPVGG